MRDLQWEDPQWAYGALRGTLHALRDRLPTEEGAQLAAQLPLLIRGLWFEGWKPRAKPMAIKRVEEFYDAVQRNVERNPKIDVPQAVRAVFRLLASRVSDGEISDVRANLPPELRTLWP